MRRLKTSYLLLFAITLSLGFFYTTVLSRNILFATARLKTIDLLYLWRSGHSKPLKHLKEVVVVGVDDISYKKMNRAWPWGRDIFAVFLENLQKLNPKVVGFDFSFVGKSSQVDSDRWLAEAISKNRNVILADYFDEDGRHIIPLDSIREAARAHGFINKPLDRDAANRRVRPLIPLQNNQGNAYSFAAHIAYAYFGLSTEDHLRLDGKQIIFSVPKDRELKTLRQIRVPVDSKYQMWLSYRYKPSHITYIPFWEIIAGKVPQSAMEGKIALVGPVSPIFHDIHVSPFGVLAGVYIHANETLAILDEDFIRELFPEYQWLFFITLIMILTFFYYRSRFLTGLLILIGTELLIYAAALCLFQAKNLLLEPFSAMFVSLMVYVVVMVHKSLRTIIENMTLQRMVITDSLTGLYVHRYLTLRLATEFDHFREARTEFCFVMIDIDLFKRVNDEYGHEKGNEVLIRIANLLKSGLRGADVLARYGGEEFSVIMMRQMEKMASQAVDRLRISIQNEVFSSANGNFKVTISAGICSNLDPDVARAEDMIRLADNALYQAKSEGRNCIRIYRSKKRPL